MGLVKDGKKKEIGRGKGGKMFVGVGEWRIGCVKKIEIFEEMGLKI